jgi:hypothetical protein
VQNNTRYDYEPKERAQNQAFSVESPSGDGDGPGIGQQKRIMKRMQPLVPANRAGINGGFDLRKLPFYVCIVIMNT